MDDGRNILDASYDIIHGTEQSMNEDILVFGVSKAVYKNPFKIGCSMDVISTIFDEFNDLAYNRQGYICDLEYAKIMRKRFMTLDLLIGNPMDDMFKILDFLEMKIRFYTLEAMLNYIDRHPCYDQYRVKASYLRHPCVDDFLSPYAKGTKHRDHYKGSANNGDWEVITEDYEGLSTSMERLIEAKITFPRNSDRQDKTKTRTISYTAAAVAFMSSMISPRRIEEALRGSSSSRKSSRFAKFFRSPRKVHPSEV